jgi:hypothetical protein
MRQNEITCIRRGDRILNATVYKKQRKMIYRYGTIEPEKYAGYPSVRLR